MCCNLVPGRVQAPLHFLYWRDAVSLIQYLQSNRSIYVRLLSGEAHFWAYRKLQPFKWTKAKRHVFRMHPIFKKSQKIRKEKESENIESGVKEWHSLRGRRLKGKGQGILGAGDTKLRPLPLPFKRLPRRLGIARQRERKKTKTKQTVVLLVFIYNGNRTEWSPIRSVIIRVINKIGRPRSGRSDLFNHEYNYRPNWTTDEVLLPVNHN